MSRHRAGITAARRSIVVHALLTRYWGPNLCDSACTSGHIVRVITDDDGAAHYIACGRMQGGSPCTRVHMKITCPACIAAAARLEE